VQEFWTALVEAAVQGEKYVKTKTKVTVGIVAALAVVGAGTGIVLGLNPQQTGTFLTETVQVRDVDVTVAASGIVNPAVEMGLQFPGAATSTLKELLVSVGDTVEEGQVLATLHTESLIAAVAQAEASVAAARSSLANAEITGDQARESISRADQLITAADVALATITSDTPNRDIQVLNAQKQKVTAQAQLETARRQLEAYYPLKASAEASLRSANAQLESARFNVRNAELTAPMAGTVVAIASQVGEPISATSVGTQGTSGFIILAALNEFVVKADFAEADVVSVATGQSVRLEFDAIPGETRQGTVTELAPYGSVDPTGASLTTYEVTISVPNAPAGLRAGMTAQASITTEDRAGVIAAPVTALVQRDDGFVVQVQAEDGTISTVDVEVGIRGGYWVEILSGLNEGDKVVTGSDGTLPPTDTGFGGPPEGTPGRDD
jgi:membrane fusion protein, macrolide-specific efflux system